MKRIAITGGPLTGKTTLACRLQSEHFGFGHCSHCDGSNGRYPATPGSQPTRCPQCGATPLVRHTDALIPIGWSEAPAAAALWFDEPGPWIIEGVAVPRALRKWRDAHPGQRPPVDRVIYLSEPHQVCMRGQSSMAKGVESVFREIEPWLEEHGVEVEYR